MTDASKLELLVKKIERRTKVFTDKATMIESPEQYLDVISKKNERKLILRFLRNPIEFVPSETDPTKLGYVKLQRMKLTGEADN